MNIILLWKCVVRNKVCLSKNITTRYSIMSNCNHLDKIKTDNYTGSHPSLVTIRCPPNERNIGPTGHIGYRGHTGYRGCTGPTGQVGYRGHTGQSGSTGNTGSTGRTGSTGPTGLRGHTGDYGAGMFNLTSSLETYVSK